jgi:dephospho-CoA kinase
MKGKIIGLSGTNGAGKDSVAHILVQKYGFLFVDATGLLTAELLQRGWPTDREHKAQLSAEWRRELGMGVIVDKALTEFEKHSDQYKGLIVSSLRHPGEADRVHELGGKVLWIDADPKVRYERVQNAHRGRDIEDKKSFEEFLADQAREMRPTGDEATLNVLAVKERTDATIMNNTADLKDLENKLEMVMRKIYV